jgi:acid stress-induced BolA-like protein IbaG/YrbA
MAKAKMPALEEVHIMQIMEYALLAEKSGHLDNKGDLFKERHDRIKKYMTAKLKELEAKVDKKHNRMKIHVAGSGLRGVKTIKRKEIVSDKLSISPAK